ncbi:hypothetical protein BUALT_Bualt19G0122100 [Buddleja alternifolia]|uniref:Uncharacterized protein n=1 Tax=Buddleja alternifolia TaxID=168488 RepID=A0AAV6WBE7_9LAMI|nr:hypothetical protein BUALT_Bualt19G0122100 [Buddleja alternifolia]
MSLTPGYSGLLVCSADGVFDSRFNRYLTGTEDHPESCINSITTIVSLDLDSQPFKRNCISDLAEISDGAAESADEILLQKHYFCCTAQNSVFVDAKILLQNTFLLTQNLVFLSVKPMGHLEMVTGATNSSRLNERSYPGILDVTQSKIFLLLAAFRLKEHLQSIRYQKLRMIHAPTPGLPILEMEQQNNSQQLLQHLPSLSFSSWTHHFQPD